MRFPHFFIERPIFAAVLSVLLTIAGLIAARTLPVSEYPDIAPPTVMITATYPGASAEVIAQTVASPIEQEVNGVDDMLYISSQSTGDGLLTINVVFKTGVNIDLAQVLVQNRVAIATPRLPEEVQRFGVVVKKASPDLMMVVHLRSPDGSRTQQYISNYATLYVRDVLARLEGVGDVRVFGARDYSMRVWLDPDKIAARGMTAGEVVFALRAANLQVAAGAINQPPAASPGAFQLSVRTLGRLSEPEQFADIVLRSDADGQVRLRDVARVEIGAQDYTVNAYLDKNPATAIVVFQKPGSNALATSESVEAAMVELKRQFPAGIDYSIVYNPTEFIQQSVDQVVHTLLEAVLLVVVVVILFLQTWRAAVIPVVAIPVSLIGSFASDEARGPHLQHAVAFRTGARHRHCRRRRDRRRRECRTLSRPRHDAQGGRAQDHGRGRRRADRNRAGALRGFRAGRLYHRAAGRLLQAVRDHHRLGDADLGFRVAHSVAGARRGSPETEKRGEEGTGRAGDGAHPCFLRALQSSLRLHVGALWRAGPRGWCAWGFSRLSSMALLIGVAAELLRRTPTGLVPTLDRGYLIAAFQLPPGASLDRTDTVMRQATDIILSRPGVASAVVFTGFDGATFTNAPNSGVIFVTLKSFEERHRRSLSAISIRDDLRASLSPIKEAFVFVLEPPAVPGIGTGGGLKGYVQDRGGMGLPALEGATWGLAGPAMRLPGVAQAFTLFNTRTPQIFADIDRTKAEMIGVPISRVFETMSIYLGSVFVNDFNILGRTYRVMAQADNPHRLTLRDLSELKTRSATGEMTPLGAIATFRDTTGAFRVPRYNLYPAAELQINLAPGMSSGQGIAMIEGLAKQTLPPGFGFEWTEIALQEKLAGNTAALAFGLAVVFVFLLLAALYESLTLPLAVILIVPMCVLAAMAGVTLRGFDRNILVEIGLVVLIGLAAKNAILIVEFARQGEDAGKDRFTAAIEAARTRLRPILMTSLAFILGVLPLVVSHGAGAEMRQSLGVAVFSGMIGVTIFGLAFTPIFYVLSRALALRARGRHG